MMHLMVVKRCIKESAVMINPGRITTIAINVCYYTNK
jgi:hypothetical protein